MLRADKSSDTAAVIEPPAPRRAGLRLPGQQAPVRTSSDLWQNLGRHDLADTVRRICTLCGWTKTVTGTGQTLAVTSAREREGKSSIARALAIGMAQDHEGEVLLLECDLVNPSLGHDFGAELGLTEVLAGEAPLANALRPTRLPNLWLLAAGGPHESPSRLLRSTAMTMLLGAVRERFAFIVLDLPAVSKSSDAAVLARLTDGVVLVVRAGATPQSAVQQAVQLLPGARVHGVVLNRWRSKVPSLVRSVLGL